MLNLTVLWNRKDNNTFENIPQYYQTLRIQQIMIILQFKKCCIQNILYSHSYLVFTHSLFMLEGISSTIESYFDHKKDLSNKSKTGE